MKIMAITTDLLPNGMYGCARTAVNFKDIQDNKTHYGSKILNWKKNTKLKGV